MKDTCTGEIHNCRSHLGETNGPSPDVIAYKKELREKVEGMRRKYLGKDENNNPIYQADGTEIAYNQALTDVLKEIN